MKCLKKYILSLTAIVICSCSNQTTSSVGTSPFDSHSASVEQSNKYVKDKRIFDLEYDIDGYPEETMNLDEFPELAFKRKGGTLLITGRDTMFDYKTCICGYVSLIRHSFNVTIVNGLPHCVCTRCGYTVDKTDHSFTYIPFSSTEHRTRCVCGYAARNLHIFNGDGYCEACLYGRNFL